ncbi:MAG: hypothetical protein AB1597_04385 [Chloroflexota bacterium]
MYNRLIREIVQDRAHGAGWLSRRALAILKTAALESRAASADELLAELAGLGGRLLGSRPSMSPLANQVALCYGKALSLARGGRSVAELRTAVSAVAGELERAAERASLLTAREGARLIEDGDTVATGSYSSIVCQVLTLARDSGKRFRILVAESQSGGEPFGEMLRFELSRRGMRATVFADIRLERQVKKADKVIVGADMVLHDGSIVNGYPSLRLARAASAAGIPFYCVCETAKFCGRSEIQIEPGFDYVPAELVTAVVTERGECGRDAIVRYCRTMSKHVRMLEASARRD